MGQASGNSGRCLCSTSNGKDAQVGSRDAAASSCTTAGSEPAVVQVPTKTAPRTAPRTNGSCSSLHGCGGAHVFTVPHGVNVEEHDAERTRLVVRQFVDTMTFGVNLRLAVEGVGVLPITAALDRRLSNLTFSFNGVRKKLPLRLVQRVVVERQEFPPGEDDRLWHVCLELEGDQLCTFVFDGPDASREASYLGGCLHVLLLEAAAQSGGPREDEGYAGKGGTSVDVASWATRTPPEEQDPRDETSSSTRSVAGSTNSALMNCAAPELVAALLAAGVVPAEPATGPATSEASTTDQRKNMGADLPPTLLAGQNSAPMRAAPALRA